MASARAQLAEQIVAGGAPDHWAIYPYPTSLRPFEDPTKTVAIVIEQANVTAGPTSPDAAGIPVQLELWAWVVVDGTRGLAPALLEDLLDEQLELMIGVLSPLPAHVWDGAAERTQYDDGKPAYRFTIRAAGAITPKENPS